MAGTRPHLTRHDVATSVRIDPHRTEETTLNTVDLPNGPEDERDDSDLIVVEETDTAESDSADSDDDERDARPVAEPLL